MLCQQCKERDAVLNLTHLVGDAVQQVHLCEKCAAERGLPALAVWIWFLVSLISGLARLFRRPETKMLAAGGLAAAWPSSSRSSTRSGFRPCSSSGTCSTSA